MLRDEFKNLLAVTRRDLRRFGLTIGIVLLGVAGALWARQQGGYVYVCAVGIALVLAAAIAPAALRWIYVGWMTGGLAIGTVVSTLLLICIFYAVITPIGLMARLAGKDFLKAKLVPGAPSYWVTRDRLAKTRKQHEQQF